MARWQPDAVQRLVSAALELFEERGYDATSVTDIAERAGLTRSTFFRHFRDKREVLFGGDSMATLVTDAVTATPATASALETVGRALDAMGTRAFVTDRRDVVVRRQAVIAASPELQEREALKRLAVTEAMTQALVSRDVDALTARVTAELGALAAHRAVRSWTSDAPTGDFSALARQALDEIRTAGLEALADRA